MRHPVDCSLLQGAKKLYSSNMLKLKLMKSFFSGCTFFFLLILICLHTYNHKNSTSYSPNYYNHDHHSGKDYYIERTEHTILPEIKVQLNSEWIHEVIVSPKKPTKNYKDFCPGILLEGRAESGIFWLIFWEKRWPHKFILNLTDFRLPIFLFPTLISCYFS